MSSLPIVLNLQRYMQKYKLRGIVILIDIWSVIFTAVCEKGNWGSFTLEGLGEINFTPSPLRFVQKSTFYTDFLSNPAFWLLLVLLKVLSFQKISLKFLKSWRVYRYKGEGNCSTKLNKIKSDFLLESIATSIENGVLNSEWSSC